MTLRTVGQSLVRQSPPSEANAYVVRRGDTLSEIASLHQVSVNQLQAWNDIANVALIHPGQRIQLRDPAAQSNVEVDHASAALPVNRGQQTYRQEALRQQDTFHRVKRGDSLWCIAKHYNVSVQQLKQANGLRGDIIVPEQQLSIPSTPSRGALGAILQGSQLPSLRRTEAQVTSQRGPQNRQFDGLIQQYANQYNVDPALVRAVIQVESGFDTHSVSSRGAKGLMQLMPATARELGVSNPFDPAQNIKAGTRYLRQLLDMYDNDQDKALAAYNWGMGRVNQRYPRMPRETRNFIARVKNAHRDYRS